MILPWDNGALRLNFLSNGLCCLNLIVASISMVHCFLAQQTISHIITVDDYYAFLRYTTFEITVH